MSPSRVPPANLIYIQSDNHHRGILGCYGHPLVQTPNLDAIAARGVRFSDAYATSALCCPSRSSIATGRYPHATGYWDNTMTFDGGQMSWMRRLRDQGHAVVAVGKLHYRSGDDDNGFSEELLPMHIVNGGGLPALLRWDEPVREKQWWLYAEHSGVGESDYQEYDRKITQAAVHWLTHEAPKLRQPWVLFVSYTSPHPPFRVPQRLFDRYPLEEMPLPVAFRPFEAPHHPAQDHLRRIKCTAPMDDERIVRLVQAGYCGLVNHLDEQVGEVLAAADGAGLLPESRLLYTSDHGDNAGNLGLFGKCQLSDHAMAVPLMMSGPGIPQGQVLDQHASHVVLFPTLVEGAGGTLADEDADLPGISLWPAIGGRPQARAIFGEYHAHGSKNAAFALREGDHKLIYHVDWPNQLYNLRYDPHETTDLLERGRDTDVAVALEARLREMLDPEATDARCKADQWALVEAHGGEAAIRSKGQFLFSPPPGAEAING